MSYTINDKGEIVFEGWEKGVSPNPYTGLGKVLGANLSIPGEVSVGYPLTTSTMGTGTFNTPIHKAINQTSGVATAYFVLDTASQVWKATTYNGSWSFLNTGNVTTGATATNQGLAYWKGFLFKFRNDKIDYLSTGTLGDWTTGAGWKTIVGSVPHFALVSQDDALYFCNGSGIGSILEVAGKVFDPTDASTYTFAGASVADNALKLPFYETAQSIAEQGTNLLIGGSLNAIYPWDRLSTSFNYPIFIGDSFIDKMVTVNTNVYIFPGGTMSRGRIYVTNGSQVNLFYKIPDYISGEQDPYFTWGDVIYHRNNLIFGFFILKNGGGYIAFDNPGMTRQVWAIDLFTTAFRGISKMDTGTAIGRANVLFPSLQTSPGMGFIVGVEDSGAATAARIQYSGTAVGTGLFNVFTDIVPVGTLFQKKTYSQVEIKLRSPLETGEDITVLPIVDGVVGTQLPTTNTVGAFSDVYTVNFEKAQWLQFWIQGTGASPTSGVRLYQLIVR